MKVAVAHIKGPRGFKGELAVIPYRPNTQSLREGINITLQAGSESRDSIIEAVKYLRDRIALKVAGIEDEEAALAWKGGEILVERENLEALDEGEYYHFQIEGCRVFEEDGRLIGIVAGIDISAAQDILTVKTENGEALIPFAKGIIVSVDTAKKQIIIKKIEGLY